MRIGYHTFGASTHTLGIDVVIRDIEMRLGIRAEHADVRTAAQYDVLLFSIYWWEHKYDYIRFLRDAGIRPKSRRPVLVLGGMDVLSPANLSGFFDYAALGDGEEVGAYIVDCVAHGTEPDSPHVWVDGGDNTGKAMHTYPYLRAEHYIEDRGAELARVEIARGCKKKCPFCAISFIKPYRELPGEAVKNLIHTSPKKRIALFAPDRASHSSYESIDQWVARYGKANAGTDVRLDQLRKQKTASAVRFGIEAFGERARKYIGKGMSNDELVEHLLFIANELKTPKGKNITTATAYLITGLPGETEDDYHEFGETLARFDRGLKNKFTLFPSFSSFAPYWYTPMQWFGVDIETDYNAWWARGRQRYEKLVIAMRGGARNPVNRVKQMLSIRGDQRVSKLLYNLAANRQVEKLGDGKTMREAEGLLKLAGALGVSEQEIIGDLPIDYHFPWDGIVAPFDRDKLAKMHTILAGRLRRAA